MYIDIKKGINVFSLFDGMSCGQIALQRAGIKVNNYYSSEIKEHAIKITQENFPNTIQLGDITKINGKELPQIDLLIGGSPCQDFSQANKEIAGLDGEKSGLFYEYLRILKEVNPKYFLLENVKMKKEHEDIISGYLGVKPILIDSKLLTGALRKRLYWTNIPNIQLPSDRNILLQDILDCGYTNMNKARCLLESDSRPLRTPVKMFHRYYSSGFTTLIFKNKEHYEACKKHYEENYKGLSAKEIVCNSSVYDGVRYLNKSERERLQTVPKGYCKSLSDNEAACILGDGWTVDVIAHIFRSIPNISLDQQIIESHISMGI